MAKASAQITLHYVIDIQATYRYYLLQSSTSSKPSKPTTYPPSSSWDDTEPTYTSGSTNSLYFVDCTVFADDTFKYSEVSLSSSYEAAKEAYNRAVAAQNAAASAQAAIDVATDVIVGTQTAITGSWTGVAKFSSLVDGQSIMYWLPYKGSGNATLNLTLSDGTTTGAVACYYTGTTRLTTHYGAGSVIRLVYRKNVAIAGSGSYTGWWADANYDSNSYDRTRYVQAIKCGTTAIVANNIIVGTGGVYQHLKSGSAFDISYPILLASSAISASATGTNNYICMYFTVTTTQSITLTAYNPVYIKGVLSGTTFTPVSTAPLTQTVPTSEDGYDYILLGQSYSSTGMYLLPEHPIFKYHNGGFKSYEQIATEAAAKANNAQQSADAVNEALEEKEIELKNSIDGVSSNVTSLTTTVNTKFEAYDERFRIMAEGYETTIQDTKDGLQEQITEIRKYFDFDTNGAHIRKEDSPFEVNIDNDKFAMMENDTDVMWIENGQVHTPEAIIKTKFNLLGYEIVKTTTTIDSTTLPRVDWDYIGGE